MALGNRSQKLTERSDHFGKIPGSLSQPGLAHKRGPLHDFGSIGGELSRKPRGRRHDSGSLSVQRSRSLAGKAMAPLTRIVDSKLAGRDRIAVKFAYGDAETDWLPVEMRDFLHFGHFLFSLRTAMDNHRLVRCSIDCDRLRESWKPRCAVVERTLCSIADDGEPRQGMKARTSFDAERRLMCFLTSRGGAI